MHPLVKRILVSRGITRFVCPGYSENATPEAPHRLGQRPENQYRRGCAGCKPDRYIRLPDKHFRHNRTIFDIRPGSI